MKARISTLVFSKKIVTEPQTHTCFLGLKTPQSVLLENDKLVSNRESSSRKNAVGSGWGVGGTGTEGERWRERRAGLKASVLVQQQPVRIPVHLGLSM